MTTTMNKLTSESLTTSRHVPV